MGVPVRGANCIAWPTTNTTTRTYSYSPREGSGLHQQNDTIRMQLICAIRLDFLYYSTLINGEQDRICAKSTKVRQDFVIS